MSDIRAPDKERIKKEYETGKFTFKQLADIFNIKEGTIKSWAKRDKDNGQPWQKLATKQKTKTKKVSNQNKVAEEKTQNNKDCNIEPYELTERQSLFAEILDSPFTTLSGGINSIDTVIYIADPSVLPDAPGICTIFDDNYTKTIKYTGKTATSITGCIRGFDGTARDWPTGKAISRQFTAYDFNAFKENIETLNNAALSHKADNAAHGATSNRTANKILLRDSNGNGAVNGISFPIAQSASADANTLDEYEEGIWTPDLQFGGAKVGVTYSTQLGWYTKIGNLVTFRALFTLSSKGSSVGNATINGFPFATGSYSTCALRTENMASSATGHMSTFINFGDSKIQLEKFAAGTLTVLTNADFNNTSIIVLEGSYSV